MHIGAAVLMLMVTCVFGVMVSLASGIMVMGLFAMLIVAFFLVFVMLGCGMVPVSVGIMVMRFEGATLAERQFHQTGYILELHHLSLSCQRVERLFEERFEARPKPEHHVRIFERTRIGRLQRIGMRRRRAFHDQSWVSDPFHDRGNERVDWLDGDDHLRFCKRYGRRNQQSGGRCGHPRRACSMEMSFAAVM